MEVAVQWQWDILSDSFAVGSLFPGLRLPRAPVPNEEQAGPGFAVSISGGDCREGLGKLTGETWG